MKNIVYASITVSFLLNSSALFSQEETEEEYSPNVAVEGPAPTIYAGEEVFIVVEKSAEFPGGNPAMLKYMRENMRYPQECIEANIQARVYVSFIVEIDGKISNIEIVRGSHELLNKESIRIIANMPNWIPGEIGGKAVRSKMTMPIGFVLD